MIQQTLIFNDKMHKNQLINKNKYSTIFVYGAFSAHTAMLRYKFPIILK